MQFAIILSALAAIAFAAPAAECDTAAPTTPPVQKCAWNVNGVTQTLNAGDSVTLGGVDIACGTTSKETFGVFSKCKLQPSQKIGTCDTFAGDEATLKCVYKTHGVPNYGTCK